MSCARSSRWPTGWAGRGYCGCSTTRWRSVRRRDSGTSGQPTALAELVAGLTLDETEILVRSLTRWFQLVNLAEDNERVRRLRARDTADPERPRAGSLRHVISALHEAGTTEDELAGVLSNAELRLVMTAHPTEARRRTTIDKLARVFGVLRELDERAHAPAADARRRLLATVQELWGSDDLRAAELTVTDEVRGGLIHFSSTLADTIPRIYRDLEEAVAEFYPETVERPPVVPPLLSFGSWIGGDRDGNPYVTPETTVAALELMREQCLRLLESRVEQLAGRISLSERLTGPAPGLEPILDAGAERFPDLARAPRRAQPRGALPPRAHVHARARPGHPGATTPGGTRNPSSCSPTYGRVEALAVCGAGRAHRRLGPARCHPPGRGLRLSLRAPGHPRARPQSTAARWPRSTARWACARTTRAWPRTRA